jgi:hypothetical protein
LYLSDAKKYYTIATVKERGEHPGERVREIDLKGKFDKIRGLD